MARGPIRDTPRRVITGWLQTRPGGKGAAAARFGAGGGDDREPQRDIGSGGNRAESDVRGRIATAGSARIRVSAEETGRSQPKPVTAARIARYRSAPPAPVRLVVPQTVRSLMAQELPMSLSARSAIEPVWRGRSFSGIGDI